MMKWTRAFIHLFAIHEFRAVSEQFQCHFRSISEQFDVNEMKMNELFIFSVLDLNNTIFRMKSN